MTNRTITKKIKVGDLKNIDDMMEKLEHGMSEVSRFLKQEDVWDSEFEKAYSQLILVEEKAVELRDILRESSYNDYEVLS